MTLRSLVQLQPEPFSSTQISYQRTLDLHWLRHLSDRAIDSIRYSELEALLASLPLVTAKTRNNTLIPLRGVFEFARKDRLTELDREIAVIAQSDPVARRLQQLRGVGPIIATALVAAVGNGEQFANGRQMSAAFGLTPKQHSSGGKERLLGISKRGDVYLRAFLIHGARSVIRTSKDKVTRLAARSHQNVAAVALANKTTRMAWAMLKNGTDYQPATS